MENFNKLKWLGITNERQELIEISRELGYAINCNIPDSECTKILSKLSDFAILHFINTEKYLSNTVYYSKLNLIRQNYKDFIYKISKFKVELSLGKKVDINQVYIYISKWLKFNALDKNGNMVYNDVNFQIV